MRSRILQIMVATAAIAVVLFCLDSWEVLVCTGWYSLSIECEKNLAASTERVAYLAVNGVESATAVLANFDEYLGEMEHLDSTQPFEIQVGHSCRASPFGRTWGHAQAYSHVVVVLFLTDKSSELHCLTVPSHDDPRLVRIGINTLVEVMPLKAEAE